VVDALRDQITDLRQQVADWEQSSANWQILYQQTKTQLAEAEAEVTDLRARLADPAATTERWQQLARDARDMRLTDPTGTYIMPVPE
jgi:chromosome segregation ATPase